MSSLWDIVSELASNVKTQRGEMGELKKMGAELDDMLLAHGFDPKDFKGDPPVENDNLDDEGLFPSQDNKMKKAGALVVQKHARTHAAAQN